MKYDQHLVTEPWSDYELLDSGNHEKLERFGSVILARPETQALWKKKTGKAWDYTQGRFAFAAGKGDWAVSAPLPEPWTISWNNMRLAARLSSFKHVGIFPEQAPNWTWIAQCVGALQEFARKQSGRDTSPAAGDVRGDPRTFSQQTPAVRVLNLFGYTGAATIAAAQAGAHVTHVDASKQSLDWAHENARLSGLPEDAIRWMADDASAFVKREVRRNAKYDGIILDPPAFGRGAKGEVWKIEEDLAPLLESLKALLAETPGTFFLLNGYAAGYTSRAFAQAVESVFGEVEGQSGELHLKESSTSRVVPSGIYARFVR